MYTIFCADMGGTQSRFAYFSLEGEQLCLRGQYVCSTSSLHSAQDALHAAREGLGFCPHKATIHVWGVAGPIASDGLQASLTNAALTLDFRACALAKAGKNFFLLNDFALQAFASVTVPFLECGPLLINQGERGVHGIVGAGTGLGTAALLPHGHGAWTLLQSEGGHTDMAFHGREEQDFAAFAKDFLKQEDFAVSWRLSAEDVLGAKALTLLHAYNMEISGLREQKLMPHQVAERWQLGEGESLSLRLYARFFGRFCRHWALTTLCTGGLYLTGGVLMKNPYIVHSPSFWQEFYAAPTPQYADLLKRIPVRLMQHENPGLWGAACAGKNFLQGETFP